MGDILVKSTQTDHPFYYAPDSTIWKINREQVLLLSGGRVLLMQIAHPLVAESVYQHSYMFSKPYLRLKRTLDLTLATVFGTVEEVENAVDEIDRVHRTAVGRSQSASEHFPEGTPYNPRNPKLAMWVFATLVEGALTAYETYVADVPSAEKDAFYTDSLRFAELFGIKASRLPSNYDGLTDYMQTAIATGVVAVGDTARQIAPHIFLQTRWYTLPVSYPLKNLTVYLLPETIRKQYGYQLNWLEEKSIEASIQMTRALVPTLPSSVRYVQAYHRALSHLIVT